MTCVWVVRDDDRLVAMMAIQGVLDGEVGLRDRCI
jgi:hypothetical protein